MCSSVPPRNSTTTANKTKSAAAIAEAESVFIAATPRKNPAPEQFDIQGHLRNEQQRLEERIQRQRAARLDREAALANPPSPHQRKRGRPSTKR